MKKTFALIALGFGLATGLTDSHATSYQTAVAEQQLCDQYGSLAETINKELVADRGERVIKQITSSGDSTSITILRRLINGFPMNQIDAHMTGWAVCKDDMAHGKFTFGK